MSFLFYELGGHNRMEKVDMPGNTQLEKAGITPNILMAGTGALYQAADAIIIIDSECIIQYIHASGKNLAACPRGNLSGRPLAEFSTPQTYPVLQERVQHAIQNGTPWHGQLTYQRCGEDAPTAKEVHIFPLAGNSQQAPPHYMILEQAVQPEQPPSPPDAPNIYLEISSALGLAQDSRTLSALFLNKVQDLLGIHALAIGMLQGVLPDGSYHIRITYATKSWDSWIGKTVSCYHFLQQSIKEQHFIYLPDVDPVACAPCPLGQTMGPVQEMLIIPLSIHEETLGVLIAGSTTEITLSQQRELRALASMFARALHRQSLHEGLATQIELLKKTQDELIRTEKLASLGVLLAGVAHELNNPLTSIILYTQLALENDPDDSVRHTLEQVLKLARRAATVIHGMLEFSSRKHTRPEPVYLEPAIRETLSLIRHELQTRQIQVRLDIAPDLPVIIASAVQIQQVLINLIMNAIHAIVERQGQEDGSADGLIEISAHTVQDTQGQRVRITVQDNGIGIPQEVQTQIFDPFFTTRGMKQGTGLGLSICHGIVTRYGGKIWVHSPPGGGAVFYVELPAARPEDIQTYTRRRETGALSLQGYALPESAYRLLVVDDEESIREVFGRVLKRAGYQVDTAADGLAAWEAIRKRDYDLILCDINIPRLPGDKLYKRLASEKPHVLPRIVFITGDTHNKHIQAFLSKTSNFFLTKPFELKDFIKVVTQALETLSSQEPSALKREESVLPGGTLSYSDPPQGDGAGRENSR